MVPRANYLCTPWKLVPGTNYLCTLLKLVPGHQLFVNLLKIGAGHQLFVYRFKVGARAPTIYISFKSWCRAPTIYTCLTKLVLHTNCLYIFNKIGVRHQLFVHVLYLWWNWSQVVIVCKLTFLTRWLTH